MEDRKIIELYNSRAEAAVTETERKYGKLISFVIGKVLKNQSDVEECEADTYLGVWNTIPPNKPDNLKAYVLKIARYQAIKRYDYLHAAKRDINMCVPYEELSNYLGQEYANERETDELRDTVNDFMASLSEEQRRVFLLRYWYFMSIKEISKYCSMSKSKVETILFRTRNKLKDYLKERKYL